MIPVAVDQPASAFADEVEGVAGAGLAALYLVGGAALGDFSARQSNIDLVVVTDRPLGPDERARLARAERRLERAGRPAGIWYATWEVIADGVAAAERAPLDTPLTRALLTQEAVALLGPDWPVVDYDEGDFRAWCRRRLHELHAAANGPMILRRGVGPMVLEAARLAQGAITGRPFSKSEAGNTGTTVVPKHYRRILTDSVGYRQGANTSMYWGPFERKTDAKEVIRHFVAAVDGR